MEHKIDYFFNKKNNCQKNRIFIDMRNKFVLGSEITDLYL